LHVLEKETTILLGWPPLREDTKPYLGRSSAYPEGVRENGMYCHGVQWLVGAARILAERAAREGRPDEARGYALTAERLWNKISPNLHVAAGEIETYGGQPNQQAADMVTTFDPGRMIWNGYTGAAGWMFRQALEGVLGVRLTGGAMVAPTGLAPAGELRLIRAVRDTTLSPLAGIPALRLPAQLIGAEGSISRNDGHELKQREGQADGNDLEPGRTRREAWAIRHGQPGPNPRSFPGDGELDEGRNSG
jgi:cyclic beta-1,2-glucan synthetase